MEEQANEKQERKLGLLWMVNSKVPTLVYNLFTVDSSENVFCQGMVVLLNPGCVLLSGMLHV